MGKLITIIPVSDLRTDAANIIKKMKDSQAPVVVTQRGRATAVMMSVEAYNRTEQELEILRLLAQGDQEIEKGVGHGLDEILAEADEFLNREQP